VTLSVIAILMFGVPDVNDRRPADAVGCSRMALSEMTNDPMDLGLSGPVQFIAPGVTSSWAGGRTVRTARAHPIDAGRAKALARDCAGGRPAGGSLTSECRLPLFAIGCCTRF